MTEQAASFLALFVVYVTTYAVQYLRSRKTAQRVTENETKTVSLSMEVTRLTKRVADKDAIIKNLHAELGRLTHVQIMYDQLLEAHRLLQSAHDALTTRVNELSETVSTLNHQLESKGTAYTAVASELSEERTTRHRLQIENDTLREVLSYFGQRAQCDTTETHDAAAPEGGEGAGTQED